MPTFRVKVTQVYRVEKWITIDVDADNADGAIETCASDEAPCSSLPGWEDRWELQNETVEPA
ncbi:hypothetical protein DFR49_0729 [Hephaestia caeni]|uniref:Uncharacterized protein n=1 Tax=Hephaestia caeni TaxID=645617 RepID=A0A397P9C8_9SPHN|nr:hypothetical protein [Hephaestia caeni]RIA46196.1 hypothetical protein DFR49_0729 [Hephaestia caeni]